MTSLKSLDEAEICESELQLQTKARIEPVFTLRWTLGDDSNMATSPQLDNP